MGTKYENRYNMDVAIIIIEYIIIIYAVTSLSIHNIIIILYRSEKSVFFAFNVKFNK